MLCSRRLLQQWCLAVFLLCSPVPHHGRPIDALSHRMKRSVTHAQLMHDKGRTLQDYKRRMWLQELLDVVHTAETRDLPRTGISTGGSGGVGLGIGAGSSSSGSSVGMGMGMGIGGGVGLSPGAGGSSSSTIGGSGSTGGSTLHPKPAGGTKNLPISFRLEDEEGTNLPQETNKSQTYKDTALKAAGKKKKKGRSGKRREGGEKRKRRARSLAWAWPRTIQEVAAAEEREAGSGYGEHGGYHLEWRPYFGLQGALH
ncbi:parathyroid hormone-like hormone a [Engraulis encrasicolus]|uniref:parathyroid hormone-like hormone a n=1 Tax=Engraulis encrasicolus TaxID=184585 RepID=UPI002FD508F5